MRIIRNCLSVIAALWVGILAVIVIIVMLPVGIYNIAQDLRAPSAHDWHEYGYS